LQSTSQEKRFKNSPLDAATFSTLPDVGPGSYKEFTSEEETIKKLKHREKLKQDEIMAF
jgi:hypothetical protein